MNRLSPRLSTGCQQKDGEIPACAGMTSRRARGDRGKGKEIPDQVGDDEGGRGDDEEGFAFVQTNSIDSGYARLWLPSAFWTKKIRAGFADPFLMRLYPKKRPVTCNPKTYNL